MRRRVPAVVPPIVGAIVLLTGASLTFFHHAVALLFNPGASTCGGG